MADDSFEDAWKALDQRYENKRLLVNSQLAILFLEKVVIEETAISLKSLYDDTNESIAALKSLEVPVDKWDLAIIFTQTRKLPRETKRLWEQQICITTEPATLSQYLCFIEGRFRVLEALPEEPPNRFPRTQRNLQSYTNTKSVTCRLCGQDHHIRRCSQFIQQPVETQIQFVKKTPLCFNCLASGHTAQAFPSDKGCFHCNKRHHTLLHLGRPSSLETEVSTLHTYNIHEHVLLSTALLKVHTKGRHYILRALIDTGSQASFITTAAVKRIGIKTTSTVASISGLGGVHTGTSHKSTEFNISSRFDDVILINVKAFVLPSLTKRLPSTPLVLRNYPHLENLQLADPNYFDPGAIDILLGSDVYPTLMREGIRIGPELAPVAQSTALGWILSGPVQSSKKNSKLTYSFHNKEDLESQLRRFWEIEEINYTVPALNDDLKCEEIYQATYSRETDGRYVVALPFKDSPNALGTSFARAFHQFKAMERRFLQDPEFHTLYKDCIEEYKTLQLIERIPYNEIDGQPQYYLPHHGVIKTSSATTKLRIVFNASSKSDTGFSLNDILYVGPSLQQDLSGVITRWRKNKKAFVADMEKMFLQIRIAAKNKTFQRFVWRSNPTAPIEHYRFKTVIFGIASAPYLALRTIQQLVKDEGSDLQRAVQTLTHGLYVDNVLSGADDVQTAVQIQEELTVLLKRGGFNLRQWASNDPDAIRNIPEKDRMLDLTHPIGDNTEKANTLGLIWDYRKDILSLKIRPTQMSCAPHTKRPVLSCIASLFDPLGWYAPVIIKGKIFLKTLWLLGFDWDQPLPQEHLQEWHQFQSSLTELESITVPRWINTIKNCSIQLHGFADASEEAFAAVIYARVYDKHTGTIHTSMLTAKTKVSPVQTMCIPRLELCGASLLTKLVENIVKTMDWNDIHIYCWTDSTIALAWLAKPPCHWKPFVANRTSLIHELVPTASWQHTPSEENPADLATRGLSPANLFDCSLWWQGPSWLCSSPLNWPTQPHCTTYQEARQKKTTVMTVQIQMEEEFLVITRFSSYTKLQRVTAYIKRFICNCKLRPRDRVTGHLTEFELKQAADYWICRTQSESFAIEIALLKNKNSVESVKPKKLPFKALTPFVDGSGILRVGGRLKHADIPYNEKHPILLPYACHLSKLIVRDAHLNTWHGGTTATIAYIRRKFWILKIRTLVKHYIHRCVRCFRQLRTTSEQLMGDLPKPRVTPARPFLAVGIDYAGPFSLRASNLRNAKVLKGYFAIFVCLCTKAIHLEAVSDLTTDSFLAALRRFTARRGLCKDIYSDCGTNFVGADASLRKSYQKAIKTANQDVAEIMANDGVNWHFIPPASPHFGGLWEAGVRSVKHHLHRVVGNTICTFEEMTTLLCQIEACLNSRPLCPLSDDPNDLGSLTPGHFIIGAPLTGPPEDDYSYTKCSSLKRWARIQKLQQDFWTRWRNE